MNTNPSANNGGKGKRQSASGHLILESLEARIAPAFFASINGSLVTISGDAGNDTLSFSAEEGFLKHNRFTVGDFGFESALDFDASLPGVQMVAADASILISISLGTGNDKVILGSDQHASRLNAAFLVTNTGADGDSLEIDDSAATESEPRSFTAVGTLAIAKGINVTRAGDAFGSMIVKLGAGADNVLVTNTALPSVTINTSAGDDVVSVTGSEAIIFGGAGNDRLNGGNLGDVILGEDGNDLMVGRAGNDILFGGDGFDTFTWAPGEGSDTIEGQDGQDTLMFTGSAASENYTISANGGRVLMIRDVANILMDLNDVEEIQLSTLVGTDNVVVNGLSGTDLTSVRINLSGTLGGSTPDAQNDVITLNATNGPDNVHVVLDGNKVRAVGLPALVELTGFSAIDQVVVNGLGDVDSLFAAPIVATKIGVTLNGELGTGVLQGPLTFGVSTKQSVGKSPVAIAAGNLLGPGNELVIANAKGNSISILLGNADGTFQPKLDLKTGGKTPSGVALGDFNSDGRLDIAVTNKGSGNVSLFLNDGDGTFSNPVLFAVGKKPGVVRAADVTGDGKMDLVMISGSNAVTILAGDGSGGFATPAKISTGGVGSRDLVLGDFSGDGRTDIAVANAGSKSISLLVASPTFTFGDAIPLEVGKSPRALATGDFDGDGRLDLAVTHAVSRFVSVLVNTSTAGTASFDPQVQVALPGKKTPSAIAVADVDLDGHDDLVLTDSAPGAVSVFLNTGPLTFQEPVDFALGDSAAGKNGALAVIDFDEDGRLDFAAANSKTNVLSVRVRA
jgi:hypothetical protein